MLRTDAARYGSEYDKILNFITRNDPNQPWSLIANKLHPESQILEFGPATGYMTRYLKEKLNCKVYIAEIDPDAAKEASQYAQDVYIGDIETCEWFSKWHDISFDAILFLDVLEHLKDPWSLLKTASQLLKKNGQVLASIPNICHTSVIIELWNNRFDYTDVGLLDNSHLRFFSENSAHQLFSKANLRVKSTEYTYVKTKHTQLKNSLKDVPRGIRRALKKRPNSDAYQFIISAEK